MRKMEEAGIGQYEISNYAKKDMRANIISHIGTMRIISVLARAHTVISMVKER